MFITYIDWEQHKLGEYLNLINGRAFKQSELLDEGKYKVLRVGNFNTNTRWYYSNLELPDDKYAENGDLLYLWATNFGPELWKSTKVIFHYHIWKIQFKTDSLDKKYIFYWLKLDKENLKKDLNGSTMVHITKENMENRFLDIPLQISEQKKIGSILNSLNDLINTQEKQLLLYEGIKKYMLQNLFPSDGESVPAVRIADFHEDWEQHKLSDLGEIYTGNTPSTNQHDFWSINANGYVWITPSDIVKLRTNSSKKHLTERGWKEARTVPAQSVLITSIASIGKNTINTIPAAFNQQINAIVPKGNNANFILESMNFHSGKFASLAGKTATAIINKKQFSKFQIYVPSYVEQLEVGRLISKLNQTIDFYREKIIMYEKIKKYYLQKLFI
ncbi:restriction endonuclease subunit S [Companilactobacillus nantensis]|uniref:Restriction modification system DNA specificity subunit n=1 Tax=Companilactobacillus nantensis DSM 16982 TaxID=1423774 RepID=A0A0R1WIS8_9LACO|nr:restriction endonuclease subunit S [Companilactobacillus nantensis]KRM17760.1 restriction modification system DNA specificity subunit [Companilactobacillus nantensis DSM 16982]GEO63458.1 hypothetical protein LNA01_06410 [Companilactobacillus nantensis]